MSSSVRLTMIASKMFVYIHLRDRMTDSPMSSSVRLTTIASKMLPKTTQKSKTLKEDRKYLLTPKATILNATSQQNNDKNAISAHFRNSSNQSGWSACSMEAQRVLRKTNAMTVQNQSWDLHAARIRGRYLWRNWEQQPLPLPPLTPPPTPLPVEKADPR